MFVGRRAAYSSYVSGISAGQNNRTKIGEGGLPTRSYDISIPYRGRACCTWARRTFFIVECISTRHLSHTALSSGADIPIPLPAARHSRGARRVCLRRRQATHYGHGATNISPLPLFAAGDVNRTALTANTTRTGGFPCSIGDINRDNVSAYRASRNVIAYRTDARCPAGARQRITRM